MGVFASLNFWPLCPGCGHRHPEVNRSRVKICETCQERQVQRDLWRKAEIKPPSRPCRADEWLRLVYERLGIGQGFFRNGKPPSFHDVGLKGHMADMPFQDAIYFWGPAGCHKTHMLCARTVSAARRGYTAQLINWRAMCQEITATWRKGLNTESMAIKQFVELDYLAVDDLGAGMAKLSEVQQQVAANTTYDVLDGRYNHGAHTDLSANWPVEHMAGLFDERTHRRITELTTAYSMASADSPDYRVKE